MVDLWFTTADKLTNTQPIQNKQISPVQKQTSAIPTTTQPIQQQSGVKLPLPNAINMPWQIAWVTTPTIWNNISPIKWAEKTAVVNMPKEVQQWIQSDIAKQKTPAPQNKIALPDNTIPDLIASITQHPDATPQDISTYFPEIKGNETTFPDLIASIKAHPDATPDQIKQYFPELSGGTQPEQKVDAGGTVATVARTLKNAVDLWPTGEAVVNPLGAIANGINNIIQKIPTLTTKEWDKFAKDHLWWFWVWLWAVPTMLTNAIPSLLKVVSWMGSAILNPLDTLTGIISLAFTPEWHQVVADRYGSLENLGKTMTQDPVGLASDIAMLVSGWAGLAGEAASLWWLAEEWAKLWEIAWKVGDFATMGTNSAIEWALGKAGEALKFWETDTAWTKVAKTVGQYATKVVQPIKAVTDMIKQNPREITYADKLLDSSHWFTKPQISKYNTKYGETPGQTLNNEWIIAPSGKAHVEVVNRARDLQAWKEQWLTHIQDFVPKNSDVTQMAKEVALHENKIATPSELEKVTKEWEQQTWPQKYTELVKKAENGTLTHTELEDIKKRYQAWLSGKFDLTKPSDEITRQKKLEKSVRVFQQKTASDAGFTNIKELNKGIQKYMDLGKLFEKQETPKINGLWLTDYMFLAESVVRPESLPLLVGKKILESSWFKRGIVKLLNNVNGKETLPEKVADLQAISKIQNEHDMNRILFKNRVEEFSKQAKLPSPETVTPTKMWTPEQPIVAGWAIGEDPTIGLERRNTMWYTNAPERWDITKRGEVTATKHTWGWFPKWEVQVWWDKRLTVDEVGWIFKPWETAPTNPKEVMPRDEKPTAPVKKEPSETLWEKTRYYAQAAAEDLGFKSLEDIHNPDIKNEIARIVKMKNPDKVYDAIEKLKQKIDQEWALTSNEKQDVSSDASNTSDNSVLQPTKTIE